MVIPNRYSSSRLDVINKSLIENKFINFDESQLTQLMKE